MIWSVSACAFPTRRLLGLCSFLLAGFLLAPGCGNKGPPIPPLPSHPEFPKSVKWRQRGDAIDVSARYDLQRQGGRRLRPPARPVVLWYPLPAGQDPRLWEARGKRAEFARMAREFALPPFAEDEVGTRERVDTVPISDLGDAEAVVLALRLDDRSTSSEPTDRRSVSMARPPLEPPSEVKATAREDGISLTWSPPTDERVQAVHLYRRPVGEPMSWKPWKSVAVEQRKFFDSSARYGEDLLYSVTAALGGQTLIVESEPGHAPPISYRDVFPPAQPTGVGIVAQTMAIRLFWTSGGSPDEKTMRIERQTDGAHGFSEVGTMPMPETSFVDAEVRLEARYRYRLIIEDAVGNRAQPTEATEWVSPRPALAERP